MAIEHRSSPPIIIESDEPHLRALTSYIIDQSMSNIENIAAVESARLAPYFDALETRLGLKADPAHPLTDIGTVITHHPVSSNPDAPVPERLTDLFQKVAADTGNVIVSEFAVIPESLRKHAALKNMENDELIAVFAKEASLEDLTVSLGFIQCMRPGSRGSVTFPIFTVDDTVLGLTQTLDLAPVLGPLRGLLTIANHDMMHHLTNTYMNPGISETGKVSYKKKLNDFIEGHVAGPDKNITSYESWALLSHADTWREASHSGEGKNLEQTIDRFFDALGHLDTGMKESGRTVQERHKVIDYFSTIGIFGVMRIYPFTAPVFQRMLKRAEQVDPDPSLIGASYSRMFLDRMDPQARGNIELALANLLDQDGKKFIKANADAAADMIRIYNQTAPGRLPQLPFPPDAGALKELLTIVQAEPSEPAIPSGFKGRLKWMFGIGEVFDPARLRHRLALQTLKHISADPALNEKYQPVLRQCCRSILDSQNKGALLADHMTTRTIRNYQDAGHDLCGQESYAMLKQMQVVSLAPEIAFLASPAARFSELDLLRLNAQRVDHGIVAILQGKKP